MGLAAPFACGQSCEECVSIRVEAEAGQKGVPVQLLQQGNVLEERETNESGVADFTELSQGEYTVTVPQRGFQRTVEITSRVTQVVTVPLSVQGGTSAGGGAGTGGEIDAVTDTVEETTYLLYGILLFLLVALAGLGYFLLRKTKGRALSSQPASRRTTPDARPVSLDDQQGPKQNREAASGEATVEDRQDRTKGQPTAEESREQDTEAAASVSARTEEPDGVKSGQYRTRKKVGSGGMSTVWLAQDSEDRDVALKIMSENMLDDEDLVRKFIQEGKALDRINSTHPGAPVVQVHDFGYFDEKNQPYLALEYLEGRSLEGVIDPDAPLSVEQALPVIKQIAIALSAAHANDVYHRDVKPENVIVVDRSSVIKIRLIDFGVARHDYLSYVTMDGSLMGTPPYMSPEQGTSEKVDERSDIYSLGALAYALLAGEPPFVDENPLTVLEMHQEASVPPLPDHVHSSVADLIFWMLEKDPQERPSKMWQVVGRIDELIVSTPKDS